MTNWTPKLEKIRAGSQIFHSHIRYPILRRQRFSAAVVMFGSHCVHRPFIRKSSFYIIVVEKVQYIHIFFTNDDQI